MTTLFMILRKNEKLFFQPMTSVINGNMDKNILFCITRIYIISLILLIPKPCYITCTAPCSLTLAESEPLVQYQPSSHMAVG